MDPSVTCMDTRVGAAATASAHCRPHAELPLPRPYAGFRVSGFGFSVYGMGIGLRRRVEPCPEPKTRVRSPAARHRQHARQDQSCALPPRNLSLRQFAPLPSPPLVHGTHRWVSPGLVRGATGSTHVGEEDAALDMAPIPPGDSLPPELGAPCDPLRSRRSLNPRLC